MLIFDAELQRFKKSVVEAMEKLETARDKRVKEVLKCINTGTMATVVQAAEKIRDVEQSRLQFATSEVCPLQLSLLGCCCCIHSSTKKYIASLYNLLVFYS